MRTENHLTAIENFHLDLRGNKDFNFHSAKLMVQIVKILTEKKILIFLLRTSHF
jgi:hypothetical protein